MCSTNRASSTLLHWQERLNLMVTKRQIVHFAMKQKGIQTEAGPGTAQVSLSLPNRAIPMPIQKYYDRSTQVSAARCAAL